MPFKSEAQRRLFHAKAAKGEISPEVVHEWEHATENKKKLPMHVKKSDEQELPPVPPVALPKIKLPRFTKKKQTDLGARFDHLKNLLREHGALVGTAHKRLLIPKNKLTEQDLAELKFEPVTVAIPEAGQDRFQSYRNPNNLFHIHSHPEGWTMHEDRHPAATMLSRGVKGIAAKTKTMIQGIPHVSDEGIPGLYYYGKGLLSGAKSTANRLMADLHPTLQKHLSRLPDSPTFKTEDPKTAAYDAGAYAALALFSKVADHADDRLKERIRAAFPPDVLEQLREQAGELEVAPGRYYFPMHDAGGNTAAMAAFKTVGKDNKLVLATVLKPKSKPPPGTSLSHLMKQPAAKKLPTTPGSTTPLATA